ncbi:hypothetical protein [Thiothrix lacustris]|uniref:hypothetical protein n=1 Tax=Thiothrix lacustris TaxID=525917 RepID=UPI0027E52970|nr:hypothetical protein [Thiothrix lacustris]WMP19446.1 hypothetical protein RCS87_19340 [Thiothrix lacustris]
MSSLVIQLFFILLLASAIGWFLGRYLCKSGEHQERAEKNRLAKQLETLQAELQSRYQQLEDDRTQLNQHHAQNATLSQQKEGLNAQLTTLRQERDQLQLKMQEFAACQSRLTTQTEEFNLYKQQMQELRLLKTTQETRVDNLQENLNRTVKELEQARQQTQEKQVQLDYCRADNARQVQSIADLEEDRLQLKQQCQSLRTDAQKFNDRFDLIMKEKYKLSLEMERLQGEKQDYAGRLRAIASAVDAISHVQDTPLLLEQWENPQA